MKPYCIQPGTAGDSHSVYEGNPAWPACPVGHLRPAFDIELDHGQGPWIVFDTLGRPFSGDSPEAALEAFAARPMTRVTVTCAFSETIHPIGATPRGGAPIPSIHQGAIP